MGSDRTFVQVIVGDGAAGMAAARTIRARRPGDRVVVVAEEGQPYYLRAALVPFLTGEVTDDRLWGMPPEAWEAERIERVAGRAVGIDAGRSVLTLEGGKEIPYGRLLIATGARALRLEVPGADLSGVLSARTLRDARLIVEATTRAKRAVVVGGGILGLQIAEAIRARNVAVTVVHRGEWLLHGVADRRAGDLVRRRVEQAGVDVGVGSSVVGIEGREGEKGRGVRAVLLDDGTEVACDFVVATIGTQPNTEWLAGTGVHVRGGRLVVDSRLRVPGVEGVWAAGEAATAIEGTTGVWQAARAQGRVAGIGMAAEDPTAAVEYRPGPTYRATRVWDLDIGLLGSHVDTKAAGAEDVTWEGRKDGKPVYKRARLSKGRVVGALFVGDRREARALRRLMDVPAEVGDVADVAGIAKRIFDPAFDLFGWVDQRLRRAGLAGRRSAVVLPRSPLPAEEEAASRGAGDVLDVRGFDEIDTTAVVAQSRPRAIRLAYAGSEREFPGPSVRIGAGRECDVTVAGDGVGDGEILLSCESGIWLASPRGTAGEGNASRNGLPLDAPKVLEDGDALRLSAWQALVRLERRDAPPPAPRAGEAGPCRAYLLGRERHRLRGDLVRIGRSADNALVFDAPSVSLFHAQVHRRGSPPAWYLVDAGSRNGTSVNGEPVAAPRRLRPKDVVAFGTERFTYEEVEVPRRGAADDEAPPPSESTSTGTGVGALVLYLVGIEGPLARRALLVGPGATLGRGAGVDVWVDDPLLSAAHARVRREKGARGGASHWSVEDLGSLNGVAVEGERIPPGSPAPLADGARVRLGRNLFRVQLDPPLERILTPEETGDPRAGETGTVVLRREGPRLEQQQDGEPVVHLLAGDDLTLGRDPGNDVVISKSDVSKRHLRLVRSGDGYAAEDLGSRHGTRVNHVPLPPGESRPLVDGDVIQAATTALTFRAGVAPSAGAAESAASRGPRATLTLVRAIDGKGIDPIVLQGSGPFVVGRSRKASAAYLPFDSVSRRHAEIRREKGAYLLRDLGSSNGTTLNGTRVEGDSVPIRSGDVVALDVVELRFEASGIVAPAGGSGAGRHSVVGGSTGDPVEGDLGAIVEDAIDACTGCGACLSACPLASAKAATIGGLESLALGRTGSTALDSRFVLDCTQCQACLPHCPADLPFDRWVLWSKAGSEEADFRRKVVVQVGEESVRSDWTLGGLVARLADHPLLAGLSKADRLALLSTARVRRLLPGETLLAEGQYADALWLVCEGAVEVGQEGGRAAPRRWEVRREGATVGETSVLGPGPSEYRARATDAATVVGLPRPLLRHHAERLPALSASLRSLVVTRAGR